MYFKITVGESKIDLRVGPPHSGYSCSLTVRDNGSICLGGTTTLDGKHQAVLTFEYDKFPWYVVVTDNEIITRIKEKDKGCWMQSLVDETVRAAIENNQISFLIEKTIEVIAKREFQNGRIKQATDVLSVLGVEMTPNLL